MSLLEMKERSLRRVSSMYTVIFFFTFLYFSPLLRGTLYVLLYVVNIYLMKCWGLYLEFTLEDNLNSIFAK